MKFQEVQESIRKNLGRLAEESPTDELRDLAREVTTDLESVELLQGAGKYKKRGQAMNTLTHRNVLLERENHILYSRMKAIKKLIMTPDD